MALRPLFPFQQNQFVQVFPLKPAPFCKFFAGIVNTNKSATSLLFSSYLTLTLSSPLYPLLYFSYCLNLSGRSGRNCLFVFFWFYQSTMTPRKLVFFYLFSDWRRTVSSKFFDTQVPSISTEELMLRCYACCVLSRLPCNGQAFF